MLLHYAWIPHALWKLKLNTDSRECPDSFPLEDRPQAITMHDAKRKNRNILCSGPDSYLHLNPVLNIKY